MFSDKQPVILIVEDNHLEAVKLHRWLKGLGFAVPYVYNGYDNFAAQWSDLRKTIDIAIVDVHLDNDQTRDGLKIIDIIRRDSNISVVAHTAYPAHDIFKRTSDKSHLSTVAKPMHLAAWRTHLSQVLLHRMEIGLFQGIYRLPPDAIYGDGTVSKPEPDFFVNGNRLTLKNLIFIRTTPSSGQVEVHTKRGSFFCHATLGDFLKRLDHPDIIQVHRKTIVNWRFVVEAVGSNLILEIPMANGTVKREEIGVGAKYLDAVRLMRNDFRRN